MNNKDISVRLENISKCYRIGLKKNIHDSVGRAVIDFIKSPIKNYQYYRSLYKFDDVKLGQRYTDDIPSDVIWALRDVSFEVEQGQAVGIIGRNGAGKSTLLKILSRVTHPSGGHAEIRGRISSLLEVGTGFHPELTGRDNVYLNATILGMKKKEVDRKFDEIVDFSGVEKFIDTPVKRYSSGMKVRLAFSVAAHLEPEILIIDEVLAVGDADFQKRCLNKMENIGQEGRTVLFVSHNMPAVARLCERAILLEDGMVVQDGPSQRVISTYLNSGLGTTAAREWSELEKAPSGPVARLRAVRALTEDGKISDAFDIRYPIGLEMEFEVLKSGYVLLPHFVVKTEQGQCAFITVDQDPAWRGRPRPAGHYASTAWIPGNLLSEGMIFISCYCITLYPDTRQFAERNAIAFHVNDKLDGDSARGDYAKDMQGVVRPLLKWTTQYEPDGLGGIHCAAKNCKHGNLSG
ncbi:MAG: ABC transporter [Nitrospirae bacterium RBG_13_43_8]|nr:MAG: ABC transporter [Nitrospirae bacterium RBG_13_43_8]